MEVDRSLIRNSETRIAKLRARPITLARNAENYDRHVSHGVHLSRECPRFTFPLIGIGRSRRPGKYSFRYRFRRFPLHSDEETRVDRRWLSNNVSTIIFIASSFPCFSFLRIFIFLCFLFLCSFLHFSSLLCLFLLFFLFPFSFFFPSFLFSFISSFSLLVSFSFFPLSKPDHAKRRTSVVLTYLDRDATR